MILVWFKLDPIIRDLLKDEAPSRDTVRATTLHYNADELKGGFWVNKGLQIITMDYDNNLPVPRDARFFIPSHMIICMENLEHEDFE